VAESIIALDGPAAAGKTTVGQRLAERLGWVFFDTGILYRAVTWLAQQKGFGSADARALADLAASMDVRVTASSVADGRDVDVIVDGVDATWRLRTEAVDRAVSAVAAVPEVRTALLPAQRRAVEGHSAVVSGRDIGTVVFPDARLKVYLDASTAERARRRAGQLAAQGSAPATTEVASDLARRDRLDSERAAAPLVAAPDAVHLPTDGLTVDDVVARIVELWRARGGGA
jgi:cytidylate kinase